MTAAAGIDLRINAAAETERIVAWLRATVHEGLRKRGAVVGLSGGIDSSTVAHLCQRAFGSERVIGILMPEKNSSPESGQLAHTVADQLGMRTETVDLTPALEGLGCYAKRDEAIKRVFPEYDPATYGAKITLPPHRLESDRLNFFSVAIVDPQGNEQRKRLPVDAYLQIVAASNMKQRTRTLMLYYYAERYDYAVIGTPNKAEHEQGFFVKGGDGLYDAAPIAHLFKTQVFQLAEHLDVVEDVRTRTPTTDTYSVEQTQEEFFFGMPFELMDRLWLAKEKGLSAEETAAALNLEPVQVERGWRDIEQKGRTTEYLRTPPLRIAEPPIMQ
jgi:NAD+ synthase